MNHLHFDESAVVVGSIEYKQAEAASAMLSQERLDGHALEYAKQRAAEAEAAIVKMDVRLLAYVLCWSRCQDCKSNCSRPGNGASFCIAPLVLLYQVHSTDDTFCLACSCQCRAPLHECNIHLGTLVLITSSIPLQEEKRQREQAAKERKNQAKAKVKTKARSEKEKAQAEKEAAEAAAKAAQEEAQAAQLAAAEDERWSPCIISFYPKPPSVLPGAALLTERKSLLLCRQGIT